MVSFKKGQMAHNRKIFLSKKELENLYWKQNKTTREIAKQYDAERSTINIWLKRYGIPRKNCGHHQKKFSLGKEELHDMYWNQEISMDQIGKKIGVGGPTVLRWMRIYGIPSRTISEATRGEKHKYYGKIFSKEYRQRLSESHKGKHPTEETRKKMGESQKGVWKDDEHRKRMSELRKRNPTKYWLGKKQPEEMRRKRSLAMKGKYDGKNNPSWRGGKSFEPYGIEFNGKLKEQIRKRDNHTCQECGLKQKEVNYKLLIHHIDYDKSNNKPSNLTALCRVCHNKTNFKRKDWIEHFRQKLLNAQPQIDNR